MQSDRPLLFKIIAILFTGISFAITVALQAQLGQARDQSQSNAPFLVYLQAEVPRPAMIAYNPSNINPDGPLPEASQLSKLIVSDLRCLRSGFDGLILYSYRQEITPLICEHAAALGYKAILLGIWDPKSREQIAGVVGLVHSFNKNLALAIAVGNEGMIDNRYTLYDLEQAAVVVRKDFDQVGSVPITTSEPIAEYADPALRLFGDFLAPNVHPAIDQQKLSPAAAAAWVRERATTLASAAGKPVLVKETGLPHGSSQSDTDDNQLQFWRAYRDAPVVQLATQLNAWASFAAVFEAFDSAWKAEKTGNPIEGRWGLLDDKRRPYPAFILWSGPDPHCH
jgi:exo-beta-1,3-glucanase (GH17 family)